MTGSPLKNFDTIAEREQGLQRGLSSGQLSMIAIGGAIGTGLFLGSGFLPHGMWGMWVAVLVSLFSYFSIEMIAVAAGEAKDPHRAITHAFRSTMLRLALSMFGPMFTWFMIVITHRFYTSDDEIAHTIHELASIVRQGRSALQPGA